MTSPPNITNITPPRVPLVDERTGLISREWYRFLLNLFFLTGSGQSNATLEDLQHAPNSDTAVATVQAELAAVQQASQTQPAVTVDQWAELAKQVEALAAASAVTVDQWAELAKQVEALAVAPAYTPQLRNRAYGTFYDTTTQTAAAINTAYGLTFNSTNLSNGVYIGSPTSRIYVAQNGVYNMQFSAQLDNTSGGNHLIFIWLRINGTNVANSAGQVRLKGTDDELITSWNYVEQLKAGDYVELMWSVDNTSVQILAQAAAAPVPAIPSVILTVTDNISAYQD
jgi:hypothetical protein